LLRRICVPAGIIFAAAMVAIGSPISDSMTILDRRESDTALTPPCKRR